jgi:hypothetical protein
MLRIAAIMGLAAVFFSLGRAAADGTVEENVKRPGRDYKYFEIRSAPGATFANAVSDCRRPCDGEQKCRFWTVAKPGMVGPNAKCWMKFGLPPAGEELAAPPASSIAGQCISARGALALVDATPAARTPSR